MALPPIGWHVTAQLETMAPDQNGQFVRGVQVSFQTDTGLTGTVFVPNTSYTTQAVSKLISARVVQMESISRLSGGPVEPAQ